MEQFFFFTLQHFCYRYSGPAAYYVGNILTVNFFLDHGIVALNFNQPGLVLRYAVFFGFYLSVTDFGHPAIVTFTFGAIGFVFQVLNFNFRLLNIFYQFFFRRPFSPVFFAFLFQVGNFFLELFQLSHVIFTFDGFPLYFKLLDVSFYLVQFFRHAVDFHAEFGCCFVHQVNRLIGQEAVTDIPVRKFNGSNDCIILNPHFVVVFIFFLQPPENRDTRCNIRFIHHHYLKTAFQCFVFFKILLIFIQRSCSYCPKFATGESRFQYIGCIHGAFAFTCTHKGMNLINEQDYFPIRFDDFIYHRFQSFFKFALVFGTCNQCAHIQRKDLFCFQIFGYIAAHNSLCKAFGNGGFSGSGFADEDWVVFGAPAQYLQHPSDFFITSYHGIQLSGARTFIEVNCVFFERIVGLFGCCRVSFRSFSKFSNGRFESLFGYACIFQQLRYRVFNFQ